MSLEVPKLDTRNEDLIAAQVKGALEENRDYQLRVGGAGHALVELFGRLAELIINRLNQVPDKHFLAFLNEAGVDLLAPRPAVAEITFLPAEDGPAVVRVPAGTQVATQQTETQPEVVFETGEDLVVTLSDLVRCIAFDPRDYADRTAQAKGHGGVAFPVFRGQRERERILYLGDQELFGFADEASRKAATLTLSFEFDRPGNPTADGWKLEWLTHDGVGWKKLVDVGALVSDGTRNFSQNGDVQLKGLPEMIETEVGGEAGLWLACKLTGGTAREHLPVLSSVKGSRRIEIQTSQTAAADAAFSAIQANTAFVPLDLGNEFFPLGQRPQRLDTFYLRCDEAFSKPGATVKLDTEGLTGVPADETSEELNNLQIVWEYHSTKGWMALGSSKRSEVTPARLSFDDQTFAFTSGGDEQQSRLVKFTVPVAGGPDPVFEKTAVNDQEGYWVRARIAAGSYNVPPFVEVTSRLRGSYKFNEPKTFAPLIKLLKVAYSSYGSVLEARGIATCRSQVDQMTRDHTSELAAKVSVAAFSAKEEGPALYLGFDPAFPSGEWIQLLLDIDEGSAALVLPPAVIWEYWNDDKWSYLQSSDGSQDLKVRGTLGFYAPGDHQKSTEFGQAAFWLRARPHQQSPQAEAGSDWVEPAEDGSATISLDASASQAFTRQHIHRYTWRLVSSRPPMADAGADQALTAPVVTLDASGSQGTEQRPLVKYIWRRVEPGEEAEKRGDLEPMATPYLRTVRPNTVSAVNAMTISDEVLGSSNGEPDQVFDLVYSPVHADGLQIAVQEPDRPPEDELRKLEDELRETDGEALALLTPLEVTPAWVRWHQVSDFFESASDNRHYILDPTTGRVRFGDGKRGMIPPVGVDNIKVLRYRTHDGAAGNVEAGAISVLRNPSEELADIRSVTNPEAAAGGSDVETMHEVRWRGPQTLKHQQRAVTCGGFEWLSREASGEVARSYARPACNPRGLVDPGWVTVVILPETSAARPIPNPALVRQVNSYLEDLALANLTTGSSHISVRGPEYIEATVQARIVPVNPTKADDVKLDVLKRLNTFLHPLRGGPEGTGWELGRNVYPSEIYAEIEAVPGVDYVVFARLVGSMRQRRLRLKRDALPFTDAGFREGDRVILVAADGTLLVGDIAIASVSADSVTFDPPVFRPADWARCDALTSPDGLRHLPLSPHNLIFDQTGRITAVREGYWAPFDIASGSEVSTLDKRIKLLLAESVSQGEEVTELAVRDFKVGDRVTVVTADNRVLIDDLTIATLSDDTLTFAEPCRPPADLRACDALMSDDRRLRLPLAADGIMPDETGLAAGVMVSGLKAGERVSLIAYGQRDPRLEDLPVRAVDHSEGCIYVPRGHLIYPGSHSLEMSLE
jgi:predicted phage baseplate assembly protein